ncbi:MAG TPA: hypothetical protein VFI31_17765 [Pirellulales bacterium]|nr:hypothetical protein [Pirellulales bacterium]
MNDKYLDICGRSWHWTQVTVWAMLPSDPANPYLPLRKLCEELMEGFRRMMNGDDCQDGPFAELLLLDLQPVYADLTE